MIKAISYWSMEKGLANTHPLADALASAKKEGYAGLELAIGPEGVLNPQTTASECAAMRKQIDASGVAVETLASGMSWGFNPVSNDASVRQQSLAMHKAALERAGWLGCQAMLFVPGTVRSPISNDIVRYDRAVERATEVVKHLLDAADKAGVDLCLENVWNGLFYSPLEFARFVDSFKHPRLGIYFDIGNGMGIHQHPPHTIELLGQRIRRVHVKDFKLAVGNLGGFCDLMAGDVPWPAVMQALKAIGYNRTMVAEMIPWDSAVLARTSAAMDRILALA